MKEKLNGLDLFSGIGGNTLGLRDYIKTIAYCETDRHAQSVLLSRMVDGSIEPAPIWDDITTLNSSHFDTPIDIIVGGFPCQSISVAGNGEGITKNSKSGLFFQVSRLIRELKPTFVFLENVPAIRTRGLDIVLQELTEAGYDCRWTMLSASSVGALHKRERWFLLANSRPRGRIKKLHESINSEKSITEIIYRNYQNKQKGWRHISRVSTGISDQNVLQKYTPETRSKNNWPPEPNVGRLANGIPFRVDRLKRLGNAVVPVQAKTAFEILMGII
jgi:DNA (cytosine-5)-methyltransferase 1